jgi:opacity protein-like surface antigen
MGWLSLGADVSARAAGAARKTALCAAAAICGVFAAVPAERAFAADLPDSFLRGSLSPGYARWDGWQFGIQAGAANMNVDFGNSTSSTVAFILRNTTVENEFAPSSWATLSSGSTTGQVYGVFLGYNMQWERLVLGADLIYNYAASTLQTTAADSIGRQFTTSDGFINQVTINAQSFIKLNDYALLRAKAGYAYGQFLPYATIGIGLGRFSFATTATVFSQGNNPTTAQTYGPNLQTNSTGQDNHYDGGLAAGLGMDWAITPGIFLRGEWQYIAWGPVGGIRANVNTGQIGIGARF